MPREMDGGPSPESRYSSFHARSLARTGEIHQFGHPEYCIFYQPSALRQPKEALPAFIARTITAAVAHRADSPGLIGSNRGHGCLNSRSSARSCWADAYTRCTETIRPSWQQRSHHTLTMPITLPAQWPPLRMIGTRVADSMSARASNQTSTRCRIYDCTRSRFDAPIESVLPLGRESIYEGLGRSDITLPVTSVVVVLRRIGPFG